MNTGEVLGDVLRQLTAVDRLLQRFLQPLALGTTVGAEYLARHLVNLRVQNACFFARRFIGGLLGKVREVNEDQLMM